MSVRDYLKRGVKYVISGIPEKKISANIQYLFPDQRLIGKHIVITGGTKGIGLAIAKKCLSEGARVLISGRDETLLRSVADKYGFKYLKLDVTKVDTFAAFINKAEELLDGIDCLVNNAGISLHEPTFFDVTPKTFDMQIATNLRGCFFMTQCFTKALLKKEKKGNVLFISSETGETADIRPYGFTKAAMNSMVQGLASLFVSNGIRVNAVAPGITASDMTGYKVDGNLYLPVNSIERVYLPEEVAETACFLLSDASGCISGQIVVCNNGKTINPRWK